jgi:hypothetical protein
MRTLAVVIGDMDEQSRWVPYRRATPVNRARAQRGDVVEILPATLEMKEKEGEGGRPRMDRKPFVSSLLRRRSG